MKRKDKIDLLVRGLKRRIENLPQFEKNREDEILKIDELRKGITDRIIKYKDDEQILNSLELSLEEFDKSYTKAMEKHKSDLDEAKRTLPFIKELLRVIENNSFYTEHLELVIDVFLSGVIKDWEEYEEYIKESSDVSE